MAASTDVNSVDRIACQIHQDEINANCCDHVLMLGLKIRVPINHTIDGTRRPMEGVHCIKHVMAFIVCLLASCQQLKARLLAGVLPPQMGIRGFDVEDLGLA